MYVHDEVAIHVYIDLYTYICMVSLATDLAICRP